MRTTSRILVLGLLGPFVTPIWALAQTAGTVPQFGHVVIVVGENAGFSGTYRSGAMPYLDSLAAKYGLATNYVADTHGSLYDYLMLTSGQTLATSPTATPSDEMFSVDNIALDVQTAGKTWKDYVENIDSSCGGLNSGPYEDQHDPLAYFSNINQANRVCFSQFATDLQKKALPNLSFLVPNACDDAESCPVGTFDTWLKTEIGPLLASTYFQPGGDGLLIIPFDEDENVSGSSCWTSQIESGTWCGGQVETVIVSPLIVSTGYKSTNGYHHENLLRLMEEALGLTEFPGASGNPDKVLSAPVDMADFFTAISGSGGSSTSPSVVQVQNNIDMSGSAFTSLSVKITTGPGDLLVAFVRESSNATDNFEVTDSAGQSWTLTASGYENESSSGPRVGMFYVANSKAVTSVTAHYATSGGVIKPGIMVMEISGAAISGVANGSVNDGTASTATSTSGSLTTTNANDILIFATDAAGDQTDWAPGPGYTIPNNDVTNGGSGSNVRMAIEYAVASSAQSATASMTYTNAAWNGNVFAAFKLASSTGGSSAASLSPSSLSFASQTVETTSAAQTVTLSNNGTAALDLTSIAIKGTNSGDFGQSNNCGPSVAAGAKCTISVTFTPTATGTRTGTLTVADNGSGSPQTVSLTGTGEVGSLAFVQVQNNIDTSGADFTSFAVKITTNPGDLLVAFVRESSNATDNFTVTDSAGQTWTRTASGYMNESSTGPRIGMFYVANSGGVTSVTAHYTTSGGVIKPGIMVMEISGAATSGVADGSVNNGTASTTTSTSGSLSTTNANDILIFATDAAGDETGWTAGAGYAIPNNKLAVGASGSNVRMAMQYAVVSSFQSAVKTSMSYTNAAWNGNIFAAFK